MVPDLPLDRARAAKAVRIFNLLRIPDVPGTPTFGEAAGDWFRDIIAALHGSLDPVTQARVIREIFGLVPKKNAKTTMGAGLMLTSVLMNERPNAEFLLVGPTQQTADLAFNQVAGMIDLDPALAARFHVQGHKKRVTFRKTGASLVVKSFDPKVMTGVKPAGALIDELHVIAESADADRVIGQIRGGLISQPEAFLVIITTQSERPPAGVFRAELQKARTIRDGGAPDARMLPVLYEFPADLVAASAEPDVPAPWEDAAHWHMVTPNNGRSITVQRLREDYADAKLNGVAELARWASQHLNVEIGLALRSDRWAGAAFWPARADATLTLDELIARSEVIVAGIDGGGLDDLMSLAVIGRERGTGRWLHWNHNWVAASVLELRKQIAPTLLDFARDGELTIVQEFGEDLPGMFAVFERLVASDLLAGVGLDPMGIGHVVEGLGRLGLHHPDQVHGIAQGWTLSGSIKTLERKLADRSFIHGALRIMAWAIGNAKAEPRGNAVAITKQTAGSAKIDPLIATFTAVALMSRNPEPPNPPSVYEERGLLIL